MELNKIYLGDNTLTIKQFEDCSIDSLVTDPPYGISFMNKKWDYDLPNVDFWKEVLRVLKPGAFGLVACGTRTQHRMAVNLEDAGFEIRDIVAWVYGSGFPKSLNIGKAVDKLQGNERENLGTIKKLQSYGYDGNNCFGGDIDRGGQMTITKGSSPFEGFGTALKPAMELFTLVRKPIEEKNVALNVLKYGTGGLNIDGCRVGDEGGTAKGTFPNQDSNGIYGNGLNGACEIKDIGMGRFPANFIHDGSEEVEELLSDASRFFYCAKASKSERNAGLEGFEKKQTIGGGGTNNTEDDVCGKYGSIKAEGQNFHPTVKPVALTQYLCRLITPKNGIVLDPFMGSGTTGIACVKEGFNYVGMEREKEYLDIAEARIKFESDKKDYRLAI